MRGNFKTGDGVIGLFIKAIRKVAGGLSTKARFRDSKNQQHQSACCADGVCSVTWKPERSQIA